MGTTPIYGIRYPDPTTKAYLLPQSFSNMALDMENALAAAVVPPVAPAAIYVAPSSGARDAFWGVPTTGAAQLTLQNQGAQTIRTDLGWTEQYFALYNASTNPGGAQVAGWYPVAGILPRVRARRQATQALNATWQLVNAAWGTPTDLRGFSYAAGVFTCIQPGMWDVEGFVAATNANTAMAMQITLNSTASDTAATIAFYNSTGAVAGLTALGKNALQPLVAGDAIRVYCLGGSSNPVGAFPESAKLNLSWRGPAQFS